MKKISLIFIAAMLSVCTLSARAEKLSTTEQHKFLTNTTANAKNLLISSGQDQDALGF